MQFLNVISPAILGAFGLLFGSFANVLIWRVPRGESIVSPGSHCPKCGHDVRWYDNIPLVSWLCLRASCRDCGQPIPWRYPAVELASSALWVGAYLRWGLAPELPLAIVFFYMLLVLTVIDLDTRRLPTSLVGVIAIAGAIGAVLSWSVGLRFGPIVGVTPSGFLSIPIVSAALGFLMGGGIAIGIAFLYSTVRKADGLGFGDVRLLGAMGLILGPYVLLAYALANVLGVFGAIPALLRARQSQVDKSENPPVAIPFGPFLAAAGIVTAMWGPAIWIGYLRMVGIA